MVIAGSQGLMGDVELLFKMAESTDEVKGQFLFCPVCRLNHDQGRKHIYTRKHKTLLGKILLKFGKKVSSLQRKDVCIHNCEEKQTNIFKILRNLFTPTDQNILLILEFVHFFFPPVDTTESPCESLRYRNMHFYQRGVDTRESPNICTTTFTFSLSILRALQILGVFPWRFYHKRAKAIQSPVPD